MKRPKLPNYIKKIVHQIYNHCCARCGLDEDLHIHHVDRDPWNNNVENLELLDFWCHYEEHGFPDAMLDWYIMKKYGG